jgi:putative acyl-CoA dehydrogenase
MAFGRLLSEQPLMVNVLADLAIESEATTLLMMRIAAAFDRASDPREAAFKRLALAVAKYWTCKRAIAVVAEALECLGGNGYVEESILPRLYREAPLNSIWEGSGNVNALDVLRAMRREPASLAAFRAEVAEGRGHDRRFDEAVGRLDRILNATEVAESNARRVVEQMAIALEASLLLRFGDPDVADAFCASRLDGAGRTFGTLGDGLRLSAIVNRHRPYI